MELRCPSSCPYLANAKEHPPAAAARQQQQDAEHLIRFLRDLGDPQAELFLLVNSFLAGFQVPGLQPITDDDVAEAASSLASTFETSAKGVIYEHRPASVAAQQIITGLKPVLNEAGGAKGGTAFEREAAVVLRRVAESVQSMRPDEEAAHGRAYLSFLGRILSQGARTERPGRADEGRLIVS